MMPGPDRASRCAAPLASAIYEGRVRHRRLTPVEHAFEYRLFMMYLDLAELDRVFAGRWLWSARHPAVARFERRDHLGDPDLPLDVAVRDLVEGETGRRPDGPVRLLTHLRYLGFCFNPVSFFFCYPAVGDEPQAVVAEVDNTPWGERHCYVLDRAERRVHELPKAFHVSPFMGMDVDYTWRVGLPGERLTIHVDNARRGRRIFDASLSLERREITPRALASVLGRYPLVTVKVVGAIYFEAMRLWLKRAPFYPHPKTLGGAVDERG